MLPIKKLFSKDEYENPRKEEFREAVVSAVAFVLSLFAVFALPFCLKPVMDAGSDVIEAPALLPIYTVDYVTGCDVLETMPMIGKVYALSEAELRISEEAAKLGANAIIGATIHTSNGYKEITGTPVIIECNLGIDELL